MSRRTASTEPRQRKSGSWISSASAQAPDGDDNHLRRPARVSHSERESPTLERASATPPTAADSGKKHVNKLGAANLRASADVPRGSTAVSSSANGSPRLSRNSPKRAPSQLLAVSAAGVAAAEANSTASSASNTNTNANNVSSSSASANTNLSNSNNSVAISSSSSSVGSATALNASGAVSSGAAASATGAVVTQETRSPRKKKSSRIETLKAELRAAGREIRVLKAKLAHWEAHKTTCAAAAAVDDSVDEEKSPRAKKDSISPRSVSPRGSRHSPHRRRRLTNSARMPVASHSQPALSLAVSSSERVGASPRSSVHALTTSVASAGFGASPSRVTSPIAALSASPRRTRVVELIAAAPTATPPPAAPRQSDKSLSSSGSRVIVKKSNKLRRNRYSGSLEDEEAPRESQTSFGPNSPRVSSKKQVLKDGKV